MIGFFCPVFVVGQFIILKDYGKILWPTLLFPITRAAAFGQFLVEKRHCKSGGRDASVADNDKCQHGKKIIAKIWSDFAR